LTGQTACRTIPRMAPTRKDADEPVKVTLRLPSALVKRAKHHAIDTDQDLQDVVREALEQLLARKAGR
jgi:predicted DNA binding CopG/RHH family protein